MKNLVNTTRTPLPRRMGVRSTLKHRCNAGRTTPSYAFSWGSLLHRNARGGVAFSVLFFLMGQALAQTPPPIQELTYFHEDELGNLIMTTDGAGQVMWEHQPEPFGTGQSTERAPLYMGTERQPGTDESGGVYIFGYRAMAPDLGRFTSPDLKPFTGYIGEPEAENQYSYAANNPLHYHDVTGLSPEPNLNDGRAFVTYLNQYSQGTSFSDKLRRYWAITKLTTFFGIGVADHPNFAVDALTQPGLWTTEEMSKYLGGNPTAHLNQVDFDWGVRIVSATHFQLDRDAMKGDATRKFFAGKTFWNVASGIKSGIKWLVGEEETYSPSFDVGRDENYLGAMILIDWIHYGGDFLNYFDQESQDLMGKYSP